MGQRVIIRCVAMKVVPNIQEVGVEEFALNMVQKLR